MDWYCALTEHLLNENNVAAGKDFQAVLRQLEKRIAELYKALLQYQMKSACSYYRNQGLVFLRGMLNLDDWDGDLKLVTNAEAAVQNDAAQSSQEQTKTCLGKLVEHAEGIERRLGDIHQDIQDFISLQKDARRDDAEAACRRDPRVLQKGSTFKSRIKLGGNASINQGNKIRGIRGEDIEQEESEFGGNIEVSDGAKLAQGNEIDGEKVEDRGSR